MKSIWIVAALMVSMTALAQDRQGPPPGAPQGARPVLDADGDGKITREEAKAMPRVAERFDELDTDKNGWLSPEEMRAGMREEFRRGRPGAGPGAGRGGPGGFAAADTDKDGKLSKEEAEKGMPRLAENFDAIDADKDGYLTQEEMRNYMQSRMRDRPRDRPPQR